MENFKFSEYMRKKLAKQNLAFNKNYVAFDDQYHQHKPQKIIEMGGAC